MNTRRDFMFLSLAPFVVRGQDAPAYGSMMWDYITGAIRELDERRRAELAAMGTPAEVRVLQRGVRWRLREMWGPFPERTPLNPRLAGTVDRGDFLIEKIIFESRPQFYVTANLYRPKDAGGRLPAVLFPCGHSATGKAAEAYQRFCILLARNGFIAFTWDPVGQGERVQLWDSARQAPLVGVGSREHGVLGRQCYLLGINLMQYRVWDAIRSIDYLETRPDVDPDRIGCAGNSGGGMETLQLAPFETRIKVVVPTCAVATFRGKTEALLIADPEQILNRTLEFGIDHPELLAAVAPRPLLIGSAIRDYVPIAGARRTYGEVRSVYELLAAGEKVAMAETDDRHGINQELREAAASWLVRWLQGKDVEVREEQSEVSTEEELRSTDTGQLATSLRGETVFTVNKKLAHDMAPRRQMPETVGQAEAYRRTIAQLAQQVTSLDLSHDDDIVVPSRSFGSPSNPTVLLVAESGKDHADLVANIVTPLVDKGFRVIGIDVRGWGETRANMPEKDVGFSWDDFFAYRSLEMGRPLFGQRLRDLLVTAPKVTDSEDWTLVGVGVGGLLATYAAALEPRVRRLASIGGLLSYMSLVEEARYRQPFSSFVPGAIGAFDVRDLLAAIAPRELLVVNPEDARRRPAAETDTRRELDWVRRIYELHGAGGHFGLHARAADSRVGSLLADWLEAL